MHFIVLWRATDFGGLEEVPAKRAVECNGRFMWGFKNIHDFLESLTEMKLP